MVRKALGHLAILAAFWSSVALGGENSTAGQIPWGGAYVGINGGYGWDSNHNDVTLADNLGNTFGAPGLRPFGGFAGGQAGYNWQSGRMVYGVEVDLQKSSISDGYSQVIDAGGDNLDFGRRFDYFGTVRGRVGVTIEHYLLYATGGLAYANAKDRMTFSNAGFSADLVNNQRLSGLVLGGGVELAIGPHWSAKAEYQHVNLGGGGMSAPELPVNGVVISSASADHILNTVRFGLNYRFH